MLLRQITNINRWDESKEINRPDAFICGDAISDLRTSDNTLSVWKADSQEDIQDALVALALNRDKVNKISYLLLKDDELLSLEIKVDDTVEGLAAGLDQAILSKHRDLIEIDYWRLGYLAEYMISLARNEGNQNVLTKKQVKDLLESYKASRKINPDYVNEKLKNDLKW